MRIDWRSPLDLPKGATKSDLVPVAYDLTGRTSLRNRPLLNRQTRRPRGGGSTGSYTMRRTWRRAKARVLSQGMQADRLHSYLVTHTMAPQWSLRERRAHWRRFVDNIRRQPSLVSYVWVTEYHEGAGANAGTIHHHMCVSFSATWHYSGVVRQWSQRYCQSVNGLDIGRVRHSVVRYLSKYLTKDVRNPREDLLSTVAGAGTPLPSLPFRWWGSGGVPRAGIIWLERDALEWAEFRVPWHNADFLWVPIRLASAWAANERLSAIWRERRALPIFVPPD